MSYNPNPRNARELMACWEHLQYTNGVVEIRNYQDLMKIDFPFFPEAIELLCGAVETGYFRKPINIQARGIKAVRAVLDAVQKKRLPNILRLEVSYYAQDAHQRKETQILSQCIENGNLKFLKHFFVRFSCANYDEDNPVAVPLSAVLSAVAAGKTPNLETISFGRGYCDVSSQEILARAIANRKLPLLNCLYGGIQLKDHVKILRIPEEFADRENREILMFLQDRWKGGQVQLSTAKVIITGPSAVGKTCLVNRLKGNEFKPDPGSTNTMEIGKKTEGRLELLYHDFGGQRVYTTSQGHFLKTSAIFIVAWDRQDETGGDSARDQYARDVLDANPSAKLIFVTTKGDLAGSKPLTGAEEEELMELYGDSFIGYFHVSAKGNTGVDELLAVIKSEARSVDVLINKPYAKLRERLSKLREKRGTWIMPSKLRKKWDRWYVTPEEWDSMLTRAGIKGDERRGLALRLFQDMGEIVPLSTGHIIVDPSVLVGVLSKVVTADNIYKENARDGYLRHDELEKVWVDYPKALHKGFLKRIHDCDIGFPVRDENQEYRATLIPAMLIDSSSIEIKQGLRQLSANFPNFKSGPEVVVELSNLSNQFWTKLLVMLRDVVVLGGWSEHGCITIDVSGETDDSESFGAVVWDSKKRQVSVLTFGRCPQSLQRLRCRSLNALRVTLENFPGVYVEHVYMKSCADDAANSWMEEWSQEALFLAPLDTATFENHAAPDVAEWVLELRKEREGNNDSAFKYFVEMLQKDYASHDVLCYLLLKHQKEMLTNGCQLGRLRLNALWLIYDTEDGRIAYPLCPHMCCGRVRVKDIWKGEAPPPVCGLSDVDLHQLDSDQIEVKSLTDRILKKLDVVPPRTPAEFRGILWTKSEQTCKVKRKDTETFRPVAFDGFLVYVHESDESFFTNPHQVDAIKNLTEKAKRSISETRKKWHKVDSETRMSTVIREQESLLDDETTPPVFPLPLENPQEQLNCNEAGIGLDCKTRNKNTLLQLPENEEEDVGKLSLKTVENPEERWPMSGSQFVFLSHTGRDNVKAEIARPTHWFLTKVVGVQAFLDESNATHGSRKMEALVPPAYMCTHALVILSPSFRQRRFCVMELNAFMERWRRRDGICVLPALWLMENLEGYHPDVRDLIRIGSERTMDAADYMIKILWPALLQRLGHPGMMTEILEGLLVNYVESTREGIHETPPILETFVSRKKGNSQQGD